jgi:hypothetical protein
MDQELKAMPAARHFLISDAMLLIIAVAMGLWMTRFVGK